MIYNKCGDIWDGRFNGKIADFELEYEIWRIRSRFEVWKAIIEKDYCKFRPVVIHSL